MQKQDDLTRRQFLTKMQQAGFAAMATTLPSTPFLSSCNTTSVPTLFKNHVITD